MLSFKPLMKQYVDVYLIFLFISLFIFLLNTLMYFCDFLINTSKPKC